MMQGYVGMDKEGRGERALAIFPEDFEGDRVRRVRHGGEWWFAVEDVVGMLLDTSDGGGCWRKLKQRLESEGCEVGTLCHGLQVPAPDGTVRRRDCITLEGVFRIVQSIASPKAEVLKRWLAQAGQEEKNRQGYKTDLDTIYAMLSEAATAAIACRHQTQGLDD